MPTLEADIERSVDLDKEVKASGFLKEELGKDIKNVTKMFDQIADKFLEPKGEQSEDEESGDDLEEEEKEEVKDGDQEEEK
jgi:hypothetical protein